MRALRIGSFEPSRSDCLVPVYAPGRQHSVCDHSVTQPGQAIGGVCLDGELQELVSLAASAFPLVDVSDGGQHCCRVLGAAVRAGVQACMSNCCAHSTLDHCGLPWVWARRTWTIGSSIAGMSAISRSRMAANWKLAIKLTVSSSVGYVFPCSMPCSMPGRMR